MKVLKEPGRSFLLDLERLIKKYDIMRRNAQGFDRIDKAEFVASILTEDDEVVVTVDLPTVDGCWQSIVLPYRPYDEEAWDEGDEDV